MPTRTYRSYAVKNEAGQFGKDFTVEIPVGSPLVKLHDGTSGPEVKCPWSGISNTDPAAGGNVVPVVVMHYEPPRSPDLAHRVGCGHIACNPAQKTATNDELRYTGEPSVVNCPACKETAAYKGVTGATMHATYDVILPDKSGFPPVPEFPFTHNAEKPTNG